MMLETGKIRENRKVANVENPSYHRMVIEVPKHFQALPGQFLQVQVGPDLTDPLLRRPFSIAGLSRNKIDIFYQVKGKGTALLSRLRKNDRISFLGPLGKPYPILPGPKIILAGGLGAAGILFLAKKLSAALKSEKSIIILGCRTKKNLSFLRREFQNLRLPLSCITVDDSFKEKGSFKKEKGLAVDRLNEIIKEYTGKGVLYACGPNPMLAAANRIVEKYGWAAYFSLETMMACGIGVCHGCAVPTRNGYRLACVDGPVFPAGEILWEKLL